MTKTLASQEPGLRLLTRHSMRSNLAAACTSSDGGARPETRTGRGAGAESGDRGSTREGGFHSLKDLYSFSQELFQMVSR